MDIVAIVGDVLGKFSVGQVVATRGVMEWAAGGISSGRVAFITDSFLRHVKGDWGDLCADDVQVNEDALKDDCRLLSSYKLPLPISGAAPDPKLWIITEADRSVTTFLWPSEY